MASSSAVIRHLGPLAQALGRLQSNLYRAPEHNIAGVDERNWPSALQPVAPIAPKGSAPLGFNFWTGQNLIYTPRSDAEYKAPDLKRLASYPLARICIENVKDQMVCIPWKIQAKRLRGETNQDRERRQQRDPNIAQLTQFFEYPDAEHDWAEWLRPLLEDMLVIDAATIYLRRNNSDEVAEVRVLPGDTIVRYIDDNGFTPQAPSVAYAQLWDEAYAGTGIPRVEFTTDQLVYKPRNIVRGNTNSSQLYGCSPTEQLASEIKIGIERLKYVLAYYVNGSTPGLVHIVPNGTPADKIREAMEWMNSELAGNLAARRQWRMMQGFTEDGKDNIIQLQEPILADAFDDLHIRKICFGYGTSPQRLLRMMNRATAGENQDAADEEGLKPWIAWLTGVMNYLIQRKFGLDGYEMEFSVTRISDELKQRQTDEIDIKSGIRTINEVREDRGYDPRPEPEAGRLGVVTASGFVPLAGLQK
jgi:Phage portal protein